jgi:glycosyltransferase involved in cell wall biosynthesis
MVRILQLLPADADFQTLRAAGQLTGRRLGEGLHIEQIRLVSAGCWRQGIAGWGIVRGRFLRESDAIHAFGPGCLTAAALAFGGPIIYTPIGTPGRAELRWLRAVRACRRLSCIVPSSALERLLWRGGLAPEAVRVIRPGVDFSMVKRRRDDRLRSALGLAARDRVVLAAGETDESSGHADALWAVSILHHLDDRWKVLVWGRGGRTYSLRRFARAIGGADVLRVASDVLGWDSEFEQLLSAADLVVAPARGIVPTLPLAICMAAGLPIVASATEATGELLEDRHTALLVQPRAPRLLAQKLLQIQEDAELQWRLADRASAEAYDYFSLTRFVDEYRAAYRQAVGETSASAPRRSLTVLDAPIAAPAPR